MQVREIYRKLPNFSNAKLIEIYQKLGFTQVLAGKKTEAEATYLTTFNIAETSFGVESKESFTANLNLANFYARTGNSKQADEKYLQIYRLAKHKFGDEEVEQINDSRVCYSNNFEQTEKWFNNEYDQIFGIEHSNKEKVINGKALSLIKPSYPAEAKKLQLTGTVKIRVEIDENGDVIKARSACGNGILENASKQAAFLCKFSPTLLNGKPVKVVGVIVYNFTAQ